MGEMTERIARPLRGVWDALAAAVSWFYRVLGRPGRYLQDFANGVWLGHPLHAVLVDVVVGGATAALLLDLLRVVLGVTGLEEAVLWTLGLVFLAGVGSVLTGLTDYKDTAEGDQRNVTGLHGVINFIGIGGFGGSIGVRLAGYPDVGFWLLLAGYLVISVGAYIGGHVVFKHGYMVNYNDHSKGRRAKEFTPILPLAELADETPTKASLGATALVLVRRGDVVHALKDSCSHLGASLSGGSLDGDTIVCPWHASTFRLHDGAVVHGPATSRQVRYAARINGDQVEVEGPH